MLRPLAYLRYYLSGIVSYKLYHYLAEKKLKEEERKKKKEQKKKT